MAATVADLDRCMRRLQSNLAYLAVIADRSHKPSSQIPPHPSIMSAPALTPRSSQPNSTISGSPKAETKTEEAEESKIEGIDDDHSESLKEQYKKLQALFPGVDPKKEAPAQPAAVAAARQQAQQQAQQMLAKQQGAQGQGQTQAQGTDPNAVQKMQNDLLRQKMMQAQQAQQNAQNLQQQQMQGGMQGMNAQQHQQGPMQSRG